MSKIKTQSRAVELSVRISAVFTLTACSAFYSPPQMLAAEESKILSPQHSAGSFSSINLCSLIDSVNDTLACLLPTGRKLPFLSPRAFSDALLNRACPRNLISPLDHHANPSSSCCEHYRVLLL